MACATATSPGVTAPQRRISPNGRYRRLAFKAAILGVGALAATSVAIASVTIAASWVVAVSAGTRGSVQTRNPVAPQPEAVAYWPVPPPTPANYFNTAQISGNRLSVPRLSLNVEMRPVTIAKSDADDSGPAHTGALGPAPKRAIDVADTVPLPRARPQAERIIEAKLMPEEPSAPEPASARTAYYDIEAHTVYMPNGERLEAHSGLGQWMDDPSSVREKNRGVTPPNIYKLTLRESLFHGVQAIRLNPVDDDKMFGRDGILAHSYMLGPNGQSNGCVSFRDYPQFLRAFQRGEVDRIVVVSRLGDKPAVRTARTHIRQDDRYALNTRKQYDFMNDYAAVR